MLLAVKCHTCNRLYCVEVRETMVSIVNKHGLPCRRCDKSPARVKYYNLLKRIRQETGIEP